MPGRRRTNRQGDIESSAHFQAEEIRRRDTNHFNPIFTDHHFPADHGPVPAELPLPKPVADHGARNLAATPAIIFGDKYAAEHGRDTQYSKEIAAHPQPGDWTELATRGNVPGVVGPGEHSLEYLLAVSNVLPKWIG
jgi:hypothetical protein